MQSMTIKEMQSMTLRKSTIASKIQKQAYKRTNKGRHLPQPKKSGVATPCGVYFNDYFFF
jgi:hypothetical protein